MLRTFQPQEGVKFKKTEPRPKFTGSYIKKCRKIMKDPVLPDFWAKPGFTTAGNPVLQYVSLIISFPLLGDFFVPKNPHTHPYHTIQGSTTTPGLIRNPQIIRFCIEKFPNFKSFHSFFS